MIALVGYNATGLDAILKKAGVPKGSFYYYFPSKEAFGLAVIERFAERYDSYLSSFLEDTTQTPLMRIQRYCEHVILKLTETNFSRGCLIGTLGQELAGHHALFREKLDAIFHAWCQRFATCFREATSQQKLTDAPDPDTLASFFLASWEGAILRAKVMKSPEPLHDFKTMMFSRIIGADQSSPQRKKE